MKRYFPLVLSLAIVLGLSACTTSAKKNAAATDSSAAGGQQANKTAAAPKSEFPGLDKSPMDMAYFPSGYSMANVKGTKDKLIARVIYSRPQMNGREIFGKLVPYGEVWRLGANQATELDVYAPVTIGGKSIQPGRYTLYAIPQTDKWTLIVNSQTDTWGAFGYHQEKDVLRTDVPVSSITTSQDAFTMLFQKADNGCDLVMVWDKTKVSLPITF